MVGGTGTVGDGALWSRARSVAPGMALTVTVPRHGYAYRDGVGREANIKHVL